MENTVTVFNQQLPTWLVIPIVYFVYVTVLIFIKTIFFKGVRALTKKTQTQLDDIFIKAIDFPLLLLIFTSGGAIVERLLPRAGDAELTHYFLIGFKVTTIIAIILFFDKFINSLIHTYSEKVEILRSSGGIAQGIIRIIVVGLGLLILLDSFGVSITPIIASLGIGSLAVALALQPTLENFFAGIQLVIDKPIKVGHFVKLDSGEEGYIHKIGWRSTWLRMLANNVVVIPYPIRAINYDQEKSFEKGKV